MSEAWTVNSDYKCQKFHLKVDELYAQHKHVTFDWTTGRQRTNSQNKALHLWCEMVAQVLNDAGMEMIVQIPDKSRKAWEVPWTKTSVKEQIWRPVQIAMTDKESTAEAERAEYNMIYETICRRFSQSFGLTLPAWPDKEAKP
jgi:hypothetical protein